MKQQIYCSKCGGPLVPDDLFCSSCGAPVKVTKPGVAPTGEKTKKQVIRRVPRFDFWVVVLIFLIFSSMCSLLFAYEPDPLLLKILGYIGPFAYGYYIKTSIRRLHDIGHSGWFVCPSVLLTIAASVLYPVCVISGLDNPVVVGCSEIVSWSAIIVQVGMIAWLGFTKGVKGPNKYGPDPLDYGSDSLDNHEPVAVGSVGLCREMAEKGGADAQYDLGAIYMYGEGVEQDAKEAVKWYRKAAEQGLADAQYDLGMCYMEGKGTEKNPPEAMKWLCKAAEQGIADAQLHYCLGVQYMRGEDVETDVAKAMEHLRKAAEQGHRQAIKYLRDAAEQGDKQATEALQALGLDE